MVKMTDEIEAGGRDFGQNSGPRVHPQMEVVSDVW